MPRLLYSLRHPLPRLHGRAGPCRVPKLVGRNVAAAKSALRQRHCRPGKVSYAYSKKIEKGKVAARSRRAGRVLPWRATVDFVVSRGRRR